MSSIYLRGAGVRGLVMSCAAAVTVAGLAAPAAAATFFHLGPADSIALDQPRVSFGMFDENDNVVGPTMPYSALLDTGATGVVLGALAYLDSNFEQETRGDGTPIYHYEQGVAGREPLELLKPYKMAVGDPYTGVIQTVVEDVRAMGAPATNLGSFSGIIGMPAMINRRTLIDLTPIQNFEFINVTLDMAADDVPAPTHLSFNVGLRLQDFDPAAGRDQPSDPDPTFEPLPFIDGIQLQTDGLTTQSSMVLDTGAQLSMISEAAAAAMNITLPTYDEFGELIDGGDAVGFIDVAGIGGVPVPVPLVQVDRFVVPTLDGGGLIFTDLVVGVLDIDPSIGGIFGMNLLTSGYSGAVFGEVTLEELLSDPQLILDLIDIGAIGEMPDIINDPTGYAAWLNELVELLTPLLNAPTEPYFNQLVLDFTGASGGTGVMRLDANPSVVPEPAAAVALGMVLLLGGRGRRRHGR